ncbi:MAG: hypothetical protein AAGB00_11280 [Planctomycetota bacterium]
MFLSVFAAWMILCMCLGIYYHQDPLAPFTNGNARRHFLGGLIPAAFLGVPLAGGALIGLWQSQSKATRSYFRDRLRDELPK